MRLPRWMSRRDKDSAVRPDTSAGQDKIPWWVSVFTDWGRPIAAIVVLVLCAPGEQHLAHLAGWSYHLSWGMAGLFSMYAGIAAVVATVRPKGAPGKTSAVAGAVVSLLLAMGAQPVSHLFVTGWLSAEPRTPWQLVVVTSMIPPFILGHLLHLAANPVRRTAPAGQALSVSERTPDKPVPARRTAAAARPAEVSVPSAQPVSRPSVPDTDKDVRPVVSLDKAGDGTPAVPPATVRPSALADKQNLSARALVLAQDGQDKASIRTKLRTEFPGAKADSVRKAADRALDKVSGAA